MTIYQTLYSTRDNLGPIHVLENGKTRVLSFQDGDEQSKMNLAQPWVLQHEYTQAMLIVLLFKQPKRVTILGLGGGCLLTALQHLVAGIHINAIELRQEVIDIAYQYFQLPRSKRIQIFHQDANVYIRQKPERKVDVFFTDIYHTQGMDESVLKAVFIERCAEQIKDDGWLILNCWSEHTNHPELIESLQHHFIDIRGVNTGTGNWVIFACKQWQDISDTQLKSQAQKMSSELGFNLNTWLSRLVEI